MNSSYKNFTVWLAYVSYPVTAAAYFERALRRMLHCVTLGPMLPTHLITDWKLEQMKLPIRPHDISTSFTPDMGKIMATVGEENKPDLFLFIESVGGFLPNNMPALQCPTACYLIDNHVSLTAQLEWAKRFDYVFIAQRAYLDEFKKINSHSYWLPLGCDPEIHFKYPAEKLYDICFAGGFINGARRHNLLKLLEKNFNFGYDRIFWDEMALFFSQSKIVFNNAYKDDLNMRYFEALSIGSMMLADMAHGSGLEELFIPTEEYVLYTDNTIVDVARYYLKHEEERERVANNGRKIAHAAHTYAHRVRDLIEVVCRGKADTFSASELRSLSLNKTNDNIQLHGTKQMGTGRSLPSLSTGTVYHLPARIRSVVYYPLEHNPIFQYFNEVALECAAAMNTDVKSADDRLRQPDSDYADNEYSLVFVTLVSELRPFINNNQLIAVVNDVWPHEFSEFIELTKLLPLVYVTNLEVYRSLQKLGANNVRFMPFCITSNYQRNDIPLKDIDVVQYGRCNPILQGYMERLLLRYPDIHYLTTEANHQKLEIRFKSNKYGDMGRSDRRTEFMGVLARCKISLVSAPGYDDECTTGGCHTVAIRYFESAAQYCHMISRHPDNEDFTSLGLNSLCDRVSSYDAFERLVLGYLNNPFAQDKVQCFRRFIEKNTARQRAFQLLSDLDCLNGMRPSLSCNKLPWGVL